MIDCDLIHIFLRKTIGVFDTCICLIHVELDVTDVDFRERVSRDGYSSTTGIQLSGFWIFWYVNYKTLDILMICDVGHRQQWLKLCQDLKMHNYFHFAMWCVQDWISVNLGTRSRFEVREIGFRWILVRDKGPYTVHSGKEWGFELNSKKEWGFEIDIASNVKRLVDYEEL